MRVARFRSPDNVHHIISRFVNREFFIRSDSARENYLRLLGRALSRTDWRCIAYAIMSNHIHLAMVAGECPAERWMRRVHSPFALGLNREQERIGPIFAERAKMWIVPPANTAHLIAYIHNNPVRARIVALARESRWTSHGAYVRLAPSPEWLHVDEGLALAGHTRETFDAWVNATVGMREDPVALEGVHRAARKRGAIELGTPSVEDPVRVPLLMRPGAFVRPDPEDVVGTVCSVLGIELADLRSRSRDPRHVAARAVAMIVGRNVGLSLTLVASAIGFSPQTGSRLASRELTRDEHAAAMIAQRRIERHAWLGPRGKRDKRESVPTEPPGITPFAARTP
jgi:hypothetical protein